MDELSGAIEKVTGQEPSPADVQQLMNRMASHLGGSSSSETAISTFRAGVKKVRPFRLFVWSSDYLSVGVFGA